MLKTMQDKVGIVTAAGSGIGRASAIAFAQAGAKVVVSDVSEEAGNETVKRIKDNGVSPFSLLVMWRKNSRSLI